MPKIKAELPPAGEEKLKLDKKYVVLVAEEFESDLQGFYGIRVVLDGGKDDMLTIPLWVRGTVGRKSKLGAFMAVLGDDTDTWLGKVIKVTKWATKDRQIELTK